MKIYLKSWFWAAILSLICIACLIIWFLPKEAGDNVGIYQNGELLYSFTREELGEERTITIEYKGGINIVEIGSGTIRVAEANCPDGDCVSHGPLTHGGAPIVCLPNRLVIRFIDAETGGQVDAVSGGAG